MEISKEFQEKINQIPKDVRIVAATKYADALDMKKLFSLGIHDFGENRVDSFLKKYDELKNENIHWHFIGHLQVNKAKEVLPKIEALHSLDSIKLASLIERVRETPLDCFVEVNINQEESKNGIDENECESFLKAIADFSKVHVVGFMMMTTKESTSEEKKKQFLKLATLMHNLNQTLGLNMNQLSMGMSEDYQEAIEAGATTIRLGRILWEQMN